ATLMLASAALAQDNPPAQEVNTQPAVGSPTAPNFSAVYCSGFYTDEKVPSDVRLISGEESNNRLVFSEGNHVFINRGAAQGVRVGDRFSIVRMEDDVNEGQWFKWQHKLMKAMGTHYLDTGVVEIVNVQPNVSTGIVKFSCDYMQRGDIALAMVERP